MLKGSTFAIGTSNKAKIAALDKALKRILPTGAITILSQNVPSGVSDQPMSDDESIQGATNRARAALAGFPAADFGVGMEGGMHKIGDKCSARFELSAKIVAQVKAGKELATVIDELTQLTDVRSNMGAMGVVTNGLLHRDECYVHGIIFAFARLRQLDILLQKSGIYADFVLESMTRQEASRAAAKKVDRKDDSKEGGGGLLDAPKTFVRNALPQPPIMTGGEMRSYQLEGFTWVARLYENGVSGILADEMGLGKTVMAIAFLSHLWTQGVNGPFLVVVPLSTLYNWNSEWEKWAPTIPAMVYHGSKAERLGMRALARQPVNAKEVEAGTALPLFHVVLTTYEIAIKDRAFLQSMRWKYLVVDEGHRLKNFTSRLFKELSALKIREKLLLTGTPLQNNLSELWSLLNFVLPDIFTNVEDFKQWFDFDELLADDPTVTDEVQKTKKQEEIASKLVVQLHTLLKPFLLRRLKADIKGLNLPPKRLVVVYCPFTEPQKEFYDLVKVQGLQYNNRKIKLSNLLMRLRNACNHPFLFDGMFDRFYAEWQNKNAGSSASGAAKIQAPNLNHRARFHKIVKEEKEEMDVEEAEEEATGRPKRKAARRSARLRDEASDESAMEVEKADSDGEFVSSRRNSTKKQRKAKETKSPRRGRRVAEVSDDESDDVEFVKESKKNKKTPVKPQRKTRKQVAESDQESDEEPKEAQRPGRPPKKQTADSDGEAAERPASKQLRKRKWAEINEEPGSPQSIAASRPRRRSTQSLVFTDVDALAFMDEEEADIMVTDDESENQSSAKRRKRARSPPKPRPSHADAESATPQSKRSGPPETDGSETSNDASDSTEAGKQSATAEEPLPKRAPNAYILFCKEKKRKLEAKGKKLQKGEMLLSKWSQKWAELSPEKRQVYVDQAEADRLKYWEAMYRKQAKDDPNILVNDPVKYIASIEETCGKMKMVGRMLPRLKQDGHKVLIFSQFKRVLDILEDFVGFSGYTFCRLDGQTQPKARAESIKRFNSDPSIFVFLISTRAGGLGINLAAADTVIIYDSDWNPQVDLQAQDRCHRFGQTRPVIVYRLATANSMESRMLQRANAKLKLERLVVHKDSFKGGVLGATKLTHTEVQGILTDTGADSVLGAGHGISDADFERIIDRKTCLDMFTTNKTDQESASKAAAAPKQETEPSAGFQLLEEGDDCQGHLIVN